jgi:LacI family transcriptional regulator
MAVGMLKRLRQRGVGVPQDISVTGFDDVPVSSLSFPTLTTVGCPRVQMGHASVELLMNEVLDRSGEVQPLRELPVNLVVRDSTGVVPTPATPPRGANPRLVELPA